MKLKVFPIILLLLIFSSTNCFNQQSKNNLIRATVIDGKSSWSAQISTVGKDENLRFIYSVDQKSLIGMSSKIGNYSIYKSLDAGENWQKLTVLPDYGIYSLPFFNSAEGVSTAYKSDQTSDSSIRTHTVLQTEDGGLNWKPVYEVSLEYALKLQTDKEKTAVILGQKCVVDCLPDKTSHFTNLLLVSQDKGKNWADISENLNKYLNNAAKPSNELLQNIIVSKDNGIIGISNKNKFYKTADFGNTWKELTNISYDVPPMILVSQFGELPDDRFWATGSSRSVEGQMAIISISENNNLWNSYILQDYYLNNLTFLSANEIIAVGFKHPLQTNNKGKESEAVILSSEDGGKNWSVVYKTADFQSLSFFSIIKISDRKLIVNTDKANLIISK